MIYVAWDIDGRLLSPEVWSRALWLFTVYSGRDGKGVSTDENRGPGSGELVQFPVFRG